MTYSYTIKTAAGQEVLLLHAHGIEAAPGDAVAVHKGPITLHGTVTRKFAQRTRPTRMRRSR